MEWIREVFQGGGFFMFPIAGVALAALLLGAALAWRLLRPRRPAELEPWQQEAARRRSLRWAARLQHLGLLAMLLGVLGTIWRMDGCFSANYYGNSQELMVLWAVAISEAMGNAAFGLAVAVPALALAHLVRGRLLPGLEAPSLARSAPVGPPILLSAPVACLLPALVLFLAMGMSLQPVIGAFPAEYDPGPQASAERPVTDVPALVVAEDTYRLETPDGWRVELPARGWGQAPLARALAAERPRWGQSGQEAPELELRVADSATLEEIVEVMDTCRGQGFSRLRLAPLP